jgi:hypothetical protein
MRGKVNLVRCAARHPLVESLCVLILLVAMSTATARSRTPERSGPPEIIYVDADATGASDGSSWADAYNYLQDALHDAYSSIKLIEIRVAQGIYKPNEGTFTIPSRSRGGPVTTIGDLGRNATFQLASGITIKGGYVGFGESDPNERDVEVYKTILSGDLDGNDVDVNDPRDLVDELTRAENSYHVVYSSDADSSAVLDGVVVTSAVDSGMENNEGIPCISNCTFLRNSSKNMGGAILNNRSSPTLTNCKFINNWARWGGAIGNQAGYLGSVTLIEDCSFINNGALASGGGGGIANFGNTVLINCTFCDNSAINGDGGGLTHYGGSLELTNCKFSKNSADNAGGAVFIDYMSSGETTVMTNCLFNANSAICCGGALHSDGNIQTIGKCVFTGNWAGTYGGALSGVNSGQTITNCIFAGNQADDEAAAIIAECSGPILINCTLVGNLSRNGGPSIGCVCHGSCSSGMEITNCILWDCGNETEWWKRERRDITVTYSDIQGGWPGEGNIDVDPCFVDSGRWANVNDPNQIAESSDPNAVWIDGDYHLKSQAGRWDPVSESWVQDDVTSPCIDAGDPNTPIGDEPFPNGGITNMGAYGGTAEASKSYFGGPVCETIIAGDINGDCKVDFADLYIMICHWMEDGEPVPPPQPTPVRR